MTFFTSPAGHYALQVLVHSVLMALAVEAVLKLWQAARPATRVQFRLLYLLMPLLGWPLFQVLWPARGSAEFRRSLVVIDSQQWLPLHVGGLPIWGWIVVAMGLGTAIFASRVLVPTLHQVLGTAGKEVALTPTQDERLRKGLQKLGNFADSEVRIVAGPWPGAYLGGVRRPRVVVSARLIELLDEEELEAVLAHEAAHAIQRDNPRGWFLLLLGLVMFYNPVGLVALQRISQDVEMACDDAAVAQTGRPLALASALIKTARAGTAAAPESVSPAPVLWLSRLDARVQRSLVMRRVQRLSRYRAPEEMPLKWFKLALTALLSASLLVFVV